MKFIFFSPSENSTQFWYHRNVSEDKYGYWQLSNTGIHNGIIRWIEPSIGWYMQLFFQILLTNKQTLLHSIKHFDGKTFQELLASNYKSSRTFLYFGAIPYVEPKFNEKDNDQLSTDQKDLYEISNSISNVDHLVGRQLGNISHSKWLKTAKRIVRGNSLSVRKSKMSSMLQNEYAHCGSRLMQDLFMMDQYIYSI